MGGVTRYIAKNSFSDFQTRFPNSGGDGGIFKYCQYLIGASKFYRQTVKRCMRLTSFLPLPWQQIQACCKMGIKYIAHLNSKMYRWL